MSRAASILLLALLLADGAATHAAARHDAAAADAATNTSSTTACCQRPQHSPGTRAVQLRHATAAPTWTARHLLQQTTADHKPLFPISNLDIAILVIAGVVLFIAAGAGMGGGPVLVPLYLVAGLNNTAAVALSNSTILAGSVGNTLCNVFKRHPYKNKPLIDWDLVLLMEPPTLIGAIAGSYINKLLPAWITSLLLSLLLALMTVRVAQRAARIFQRESAARQEEAAAAAAAAGTSPTAAAGAVVSSPRLRTGPAGNLHIATASSGGSYAAPAGSEPANSSQGAGQQLHRRPSNSSSISLTDEAGALAQQQLLAEERAAQVGPSDQQQPTAAITKAQPAAGTVFGWPMHSAATTSMHASFSDPRPAGAAGMARAGSAPAPCPVGSAAPADQQQQRSPFRGTLSTVPSSVLLNLELEGNISEAALQRLAMLDNAAAARGASELDPVEASLSSMFGVALPTRWQQQQQHPQRQQRQQQPQQQRTLERRSLEEPPSEAECRLLYAPPAHTRKDSWEEAWEEEEAAAQGEQRQPQAAGQASAQRSSSRSPLAAPPQGTAALPPARTAAAAAAAAPAPAPEAGHTCSSRGVELVPHHPAAAAAAAGAAAHSGGSFRSHHREAAPPPEVAAADKAEAVARMLAAEAAQVPLLPAALLLLMFLAVLLTSLFSRMAPCGSVAYWLVQWAVAPMLAAVWAFSRRLVLRKVALKKATHQDFHGEVRWTPRKTLVFPAICSIAGIIAGMFGLGGAVVKTPLMLELGVHPSVTAATTQTMLLLTSSASSIVYAQLGDTPWDWAAVMLPMAFVATLAGQAAIDWLVKKVGRSSMVVLVLAAFFILATCLSIYTLSGAARAVAANPELLGKLGRICR